MIYAIMGSTGIICATAIILYALSLGIDGMLIAGGLSGIFGVVAGGGAYQIGQRKGKRRVITDLKKLKGDDQ